MTDSIGSALGRLGASFQVADAHVGQASTARAERASLERLSFDELRALADVDDVLRPEELDLPRSEAFLSTASTADARRLPPPPMRAPDGQTLYRTVARFLDAPLSAIAAEPVALQKEAALRTLLRGIHGLEVEIRERISRGRHG
ncbi:hypothetical protein L6R52_06050 [Myxococcota bacterium]|nr:hypothetical protein [Myxococcota bacterium]